MKKINDLRFSARLKSRTDLYLYRGIGAMAAGAVVLIEFFRSKRLQLT